MIIAVTNRLLCRQGDFRERLEQIARCRPHSIILREKDLSPAEYEQLAAECLTICNRYNVPLAINSYIDVARKLKVPHLHLPWEIFLRRLHELSGFRQTGVSVHSPAEALSAEGLGAGYLIAGHIFPTDCKKGVPPRGLEFLQEVCAAVSIPVFAIGGITQFNVRDVLQAGAAGVCVMSQLMTCENPGDVLAALSIELFARREAMLDLRAKLLFAEQQRLAGESTISLDEAHRRLEKKINGKV